MTINGMNLSEISTVILSAHLEDAEVGGYVYWAIHEELDYRKANPEYDVA